MLAIRLALLSCAIASQVPGPVVPPDQFETTTLPPPIYFWVTNKHRTPIYVWIRAARVPEVRWSKFTVPPGKSSKIELGSHDPYDVRIEGDRWICGANAIDLRQMLIDKQWVSFYLLGEFRDVVEANTSGTAVIHQFVPVPEVRQGVRVVPSDELNGRGVVVDRRFAEILLKEPPRPPVDPDAPEPEPPPPPGEPPPEF